MSVQVEGDRRHRHPTIQAPPPELIDDSIAKILLRLPPDDPACLVRASLVCKLWRRILSESTFPHRYREFHPTPPLLGFLRSTYCDSRFIPITARIPFLQPAFGCRALDCRHGRVLFTTGERESRYAVWDPITGDHKFLSDPDPHSWHQSGVVLCAAAGCSHRGCQDGPFVVVIVNSTLDGTKASAWVYSSKSDAWRWSAPATLQLPEASYSYRKRGALVGDQIYILSRGTIILKYDTGKHCLTTIPLPRINTDCYPGVLMTMDDGSSLGFVAIKDSTLHMWARRANPDGSMGWVQDRVVSLNNLGPIIPWSDYTSMIVIGFAESVNSLLLHDRSFIFELKSGQFKKLSNPWYDLDVFPYLNFYIPDFDSRKSPLPLMETKL